NRTLEQLGLDLVESDIDEKVEDKVTGLKMIRRCKTINHLKVDMFIANIVMLLSQRWFNDPSVQSDMELCPFKVIVGPVDQLLANPLRLITKVTTNDSKLKRNLSMVLIKRSFYGTAYLTGYGSLLASAKFRGGFE
nr:hypothetical protein [Tanacetum cinerariifolium]